MGLALTNLVILTNLVESLSQTPSPLNLELLKQPLPGYSWVGASPHACLHDHDGFSACAVLPPAVKWQEGIPLLEQVRTASSHYAPYREKLGMTSELLPVVFHGTPATPPSATAWPAFRHWTALNLSSGSEFSKLEISFYKPIPANSTDFLISHWKKGMIRVDDLDQPVVYKRTPDFVRAALADGEDREMLYRGFKVQKGDWFAPDLLLGDSAATTSGSASDANEWLRAYPDTDPRFYLWMGVANLSARAHFDNYHNVFVQVFGKKSFYLWPHDVLFLDPLPSIYPHLHPSTRHVSSPSFASSHPPPIKVILSEGDCLYLPPGFLHQATSVTRVSIAASALTPIPMTRKLNELIRGSFPLPFLEGDWGPEVLIYLAGRFLQSTWLALRQRGRFTTVLLARYNESNSEYIIDTHERGWLTPTCATAADVPPRELATFEKNERTRALELAAFLSMDRDGALTDAGNEVCANVEAYQASFFLAYVEEILNALRRDAYTRILDILGCWKDVDM